MRALVLVAVVLLAACGAPPRPPQATQADRLNAAGSDALAAGRPRAAAARFSAAADASRSVDDGAGLSRDLHNRGMALLAAGETEAAVADLSESARLAETAGTDPHDRARTNLALTTALVQLGRLDAAAEAVSVAMLAADADGDSSLRARARSTRAAIALRRGDLDAAQADLDAALPMCGSDDGALGAVVVNRGHLRNLRGEATQALVDYELAADAFRKAADQAGIAAALEGAARSCEASGDRTGAAQRWRRAALVPSGGEPARQRRLAEAARLTDR
jgi:tetratricopeptide (TPR) repeat protein